MITRTLVDSYVRLCATVVGFKDREALLLIVLAFLAMLQQRRGPKMRPHRVEQPEHKLPRLPEVYRMPITVPPHSGYAAVVLSTVPSKENFRLAVYVQIRVFILLLYIYMS